jgi:hypothetical protein
VLCVVSSFCAMDVGGIPRDFGRPDRRPAGVDVRGAARQWDADGGLMSDRDVSEARVVPATGLAERPVPSDTCWTSAANDCS